MEQQMEQEFPSRTAVPALAFWRQFKGVDFPDITAEQIAGRTHRVRFGLVADRRSVPYELIEGGGESRVLSG